MMVEKSQDTHEIARILIERHGAKAQSEAARKAVEFEGKGDQDQAQIWRNVEASISEKRGPHES